VGSSDGSKNTGVIRFENGFPKDKFFGFNTQVIEEDIESLASLGIISYDRSCVATFNV
jgi:hypothetical protein